MSATVLIAGCGSGTLPPSATPLATGSPSFALQQSGPPTAEASLEAPGLNGASPGAGATQPSPGPTQAISAPSARRRLVSTTMRLRLPYPLSRTVAFVDGATILVCGGLTRTGTTGTILRLALTGDTVVRAGRLASAVHDAAGATLRGSSYVLGGGRISQDSVVQRVASSGRTSLIGRLPAARADLAALAVGRSLVVLGGGANGRADRRVLSTVDGIHYRAIATLPTGVRYAAVAQLAGRIYVFGGSGDTGDVSTIQIVDPAAGTARVVGHLPATLSHATAFVIGADIFIAGGRRAGRPLATILQFDPATGRTFLVGQLPRPMSDAASAVIGGTAYLIGGEGSGLLSSVVSITVT